MIKEGDRLYCYKPKGLLYQVGKWYVAGIVLREELDNSRSIYINEDGDMWWDRRGAWFKTIKDVNADFNLEDYFYTESQLRKMKIKKLSNELQ